LAKGMIDFPLTQRTVLLRDRADADKEQILEPLMWSRHSSGSGQDGIVLLPDLDARLARRNERNGVISPRLKYRPA
jgi:hypothetical protein